MTPARRLLASVLVIAAAGCTSSEPPPPQPASSTVPDQDRELERAMQEPLQRARAVEAEMREARKDQDQRLEEEGG